MYKPRILGLKNEEFPFLVNKWFVVYKSVKKKNELKKIQIEGYNGVRTVYQKVQKSCCMEKEIWSRKFSLEIDTRLFEGSAVIPGNRHEN